MSIFKRLKFWGSYREQPSRIKYTRRIICAANKLSDGTVICGSRHSDTVMYKVAINLKNDGVSKLRLAEEGFVDQHGTWVNRQDAWTIAKAAGQIRRSVSGDDVNGGTLYSENLY